MRWLSLFPMVLAVSACKVAVNPPEGGHVASVSGAYTCTAEQPCLIDVVDTYFEDVFLPRAEQGYAFAGWEAGEDALCGGSHDDCRLSTRGFEASSELMRRLQRDDTYRLAPTFLPHQREAFDGQWYGELLGSIAYRTTEHEAVQISVLGSEIRIVEQRFSERVVCEYSGQFAVSDASAMRAREAFTGDYACTGGSVSNGQFAGFIYAVTDHQIAIEMEVNPEEGERRETVSVLHRDEFRLEDAVARAAELPGREFTEEDLGSYEANQVMGGPKCAAFPAEDSHAEFAITGPLNDLTISTRVLGSEDCLFEQNDHSRLFGSYTCSNGDQGLWESEGIRVHKTPQGELVSMELTRFGHFCSVLHLAGWRSGTYNP